MNTAYESYLLHAVSEQSMAKNNCTLKEDCLKSKEENFIKNSTWTPECMLRPFMGAIALKWQTEWL